MYFNPPDRDLKETDEAFRLRRIGRTNCLTYKGPKRDAETKTRTEIEVPLGDGDETAADMERMLVALGYRPVVVVRKQRRVYRFDTRAASRWKSASTTSNASGRSWNWRSWLPEEQYEAAKAVLARRGRRTGADREGTAVVPGMVLEAKKKRR